MCLSYIKRNYVLLPFTKQSPVIQIVRHFTNDQYKSPVFFVFNPHPVITIREEKKNDIKQKNLNWNCVYTRYRLSFTDFVVGALFFFSPQKCFHIAALAALLII